MEMKPVPVEQTTPPPFIQPNTYALEMDSSDKIDKLASALCKAQARFGNAHKDTNNAFFKTKYADLASVWDAVREPMTAEGLSFTQLAGGDGKGIVTVTGVLMHTSGQYIKSTLTMFVVQNTPQGIGSCITYARRYQLAAVFGIAPAEDDGNEASGKTVDAAGNTRNTPPMPQSAPQTSPKAAPAAQTASAIKDTAMDAKTVKALRASLNKDLAACTSEASFKTVKDGLVAKHGIQVYDAVTGVRAGETIKSLMTEHWQRISGDVLAKFLKNVDDCAHADFFAALEEEFTNSPGILQKHTQAKNALNDKGTELGIDGYDFPTQEET